MKIITVNDYGKENIDEDEVDGDSEHEKHGGCCHACFLKAQLGEKNGRGNQRPSQPGTKIPHILNIFKSPQKSLARMNCCFQYKVPTDSNQE